MAQRGKALLCSRAWQTTACGSKLALRLSIYSLNYDLDVKCPHTHSSSWSLIPQPAAASRGCATFRGWNLIRGRMLLGCGSGGLQPSQFLTWLFLFLLLVPLFLLPFSFSPVLFPTFHSETQTKPRALDMLEEHSMPELQSYPRMDIFFNKHFKLLNIAVAWIMDKVKQQLLRKYQGNTKSWEVTHAPRDVLWRCLATCLTDPLDMWMPGLHIAHSNTHDISGLSRLRDSME